MKIRMPEKSRGKGDPRAPDVGLEITRGVLVGESIRKGRG